MKVPGRPKNFSMAFRFIVEIDGISEGGFSEVSGLQSEIELEEYREGGLNGYAHRFPKATKHSPIVLKRGISTSTKLWDWYFDAANGNVVRREGSIIMLNGSGETMGSWYFTDAYPTKWIGPSLSASSNAVAIESIEIVHNGLKLQK